MKNRIYELAKRRPPGNLENFGIDLLADPASPRLSVWRGVGHHTHGAICLCHELFNAWQEHLNLSGAEWLIPVLMQHANGDRVPIEEILEAYERHHGTPAPYREAY